ncbi:hypothetical protein M9434_004759 [Picochlorum sp. BPE23]|nr:hypothetical protein M9434_004759 [Picochlorum sp. BPE23]
MNISVSIISPSRALLLFDRHGIEKCRQSVPRTTCIPCGRNKRTKTLSSATDSPSTSTSWNDYSSWPSEAARRTAFGTTPGEVVNHRVSEIRGSLPSWLHGTYYRNGPGTYENGTDGGMLHLFDGYGMVVKIDMDGRTNEATISNAFVKSKAYTRYKETGVMEWREFGTPKVAGGVLEEIRNVFRTIVGSIGIGQGVTDNASVHVIPRGTEMWAMTETVPGTYRIDPETLETMGRVEYDDSMEGTLTTAHPHVLSDGRLVNILSEPGKGFTVYMCDGNVREKIAYVPHARPLSPAWIHDFPGTDSCIVIPEMPLYFNLSALTLGTNASHLFLDWIPEDGTTLHIVDVASGSVHRVKDVPPCFVFHWANAFTSGDDGQYLNIDATVYDDPDIVKHLLLDSVRAGPDTGRELPPSALRRLVLERLPNGDFSLVRSKDDGAWHRLSNDENRDFGNFTDFPTVNPSKKGKQHRYVWLSAAQRPTNVTNALVKFDTETSHALRWHEPGSLPGEPCFVQNPSSDGEDDGVILSMLIEGDSGASSVLVLDAKSMTELARIPCPIPITSGFHGSFVSHTSL